ncbi:MAG: chorismate mutase [Alphaproteobacteria bacterium]|nr:chorismate mutase [Alphaproteobacteria bacterium]MDX5370408.1 chorismate mutase [Alphaproteobacteria bacterium]MDX5464916.1 chorismate mutase [Alphaproteobacteria bacterium]
MAETSAALERARHEIDRIDDALHSLLMERVELVSAIASAKTAKDADQTRVALRPAREAQVLRRLLAQHAGVLPFDVVVRIWREMMAAFTRLQGPFSVVVSGGTEPLAYWDLARFYYGATTPMSLVNSAQAAVQMVGQGTGVVAIVPVGGDDAGAPWWVHLGEGADQPRVLARLPLVQGSDVTRDHPQAYTVAIAPLEPSGDDLSLVAVTTAGDVTRARVVTTLEGAGFAARTLELAEEAGGDERIHLVEVDGFFASGADPRLAALKPRPRGLVRDIRVVGTFARSLGPVDGGDVTAAAGAAGAREDKR